MTGGLETVFLANRNLLIKFLRARGAGENAEDLAQEVWFRAIAAQAGPIAEPLSYLYRTAHNLMLDQHRSARQRGLREIAYVDAHVAGGAGIPSEEQRAIARDWLLKLDRELRELGEPTNLIFRRFRVDGVGQKQIAADLGVSLTTVEKHLQRAYRAIVLLKQEFDTE